MAVFTWKGGSVPEGMKVKQVYGVAFTNDGRVLLRIEQVNEEDYFSLAGGKPEKEDKTDKDTLKREFLEEVNTTLKKIEYIGYQLVKENNKAQPYAQVRMVALIDEIGEVKPDPDNGQTYKRLLTTPKRAIKLLNWGKAGKKMIKAAVKIAKKDFNIKLVATKEEFL